MKNIIYFIAIITLFSCKTDIKNRNAKVEVEEGATVASSEKQEDEKATSNNDMLGFYVGGFKKLKDDYEKNISVDEGFYWDRTNKINISIDKIEDTIVIGHSVVAGNDRVFKGIVKKEGNGYRCVVKEPGDDKYDGVFNFTIENDKLIGTWEAYKNIDIKNRKYSLARVDFEYNPNQMLIQDRRYIDWGEKIQSKEVTDYGDGDVEHWIKEEYSSATELIYSINASNRLLKKEEVENMKKGDLLIIRNTIYARHGYSFKNRPLRVFFDAQDWYIPIHTDIKKDFTSIEKENIKLLLKYEKNAKEYYDYFGRG